MKYLFILIPIIIIILLIVPIEFKVKYKYEKGKSKLNITTSYLLDLFKPEIYPFDNEKRSRIHKTGVTDRINSIYKNQRYKEFIHIIWDKLSVDLIKWETKIGFEDPFLVGIASGSLWYFKSLIISYLLTKKEVKDLSYNVVPNFSQNQLDIQFDCIIKIRIVYIITVWIWILRFQKGGEKVDRASNRRLNENYNE